MSLFLTCTMSKECPSCPLIQLYAYIHRWHFLRSSSRSSAISRLLMHHLMKSEVVKAPSTLIRFLTKTELFCSVFQKVCVHTYRFGIVFARPHYNDRLRFENAFIPSMHVLKWTRRMRFSIYRPAKLVGNWSHMVAFVCHFGNSRSSGLAPRRVYFDEATVFT